MNKITDYFDTEEKKTLYKFLIKEKQYKIIFKLFQNIHPNSISVTLNFLELKPDDNLKEIIKELDFELILNTNKKYVVYLK